MPNQSIKPRIKHVDTIIIGGGISGLSCARRLTDSKKDFLLISKKIGGRIISSKDGDVNYGAYYITSDYNNVAPFVQRKERLNPMRIHFHGAGATYSAVNTRLIQHSPELVRFVLLLKKFRKRYKLFKVNCESLSQREALERDPFLHELYRVNAKEIIKRHTIEGIITPYMSEILFGTTFSGLNELNGFSFLQFSLPLIIPTYEFTFLPYIITRDFQSSIINDTALAIGRYKKKYLITTKNRSYSSRNLVIATPPHISKKLLGLKDIKNPVRAYMIHLRGEIGQKWRDCQLNLFSARSKILAIARQKDGSYLFYSRTPEMNLKKYFSAPIILKKHYWNPAFNLGGSTLWDCEIQKNLYLIGDHNICGLEDSFITGIYAANKILSDKK